MKSLDLESAPNYLILLAIAPILISGIWFIASETIMGREFRPKISVREIEKRFLWLVISSLITLTFVLAFWRIVKVPAIILIVLLTIFTISHFNRRNKEIEIERNALENQLPIMIQYLVLIISSGVSPIKAIQLFSERTESLISTRIRLVVEKILNGSAFSSAIDELIRKSDTPGVRRFGNTLIIAIERGSPLVPILTALVRDCRQDSKNEVLRKAGRSEILLMVPVVFLLLPISVLFALYPSLSQLG
jgi:tight adherence protein C